MYYANAISLIAAASLCGCATLPDVSYKYYPVRSSSSVTLTQTIGCTAAKNEVLVMHAVAVTTSYSADTAKAPVSFRIKDLDRFSADVDVAMTLTDDGRLRGINQSSTGQGEAIVKSVVALGTTLAALPKQKILEEKPAPTAKECDEIEKWGDKKPITLIYRASFSQANTGSTVPLSVSQESKALYDRFRNFLPTFAVHVDPSVVENGNRPVAAIAESDTVPLTLQKLGFLGFSLRENGKNNTIHSSRVLTPLDDTYTLPIPKAALFGKQTFSLTLSDAGAVTSIGYGKSAGAAGAFNAAGALAGTQTASAEAAEMKAQADLIFQQQRLMLCLTKPDQCK